MHSFRKCLNQNSIAYWTMRTRDAPYMEFDDRDLFQHGVDGGKRELSKNHVVKGIIENCFAFLHPIELVEICYSCT